MESSLSATNNALPTKPCKNDAACPALVLQLSQQLVEQDLIKAEYDVAWDSSLQQPVLADAHEHIPEQSAYVGVHKVPGRNRWPYRAVLALPTCMTAGACLEPLLCEAYYSTAEAAARAVDAICIVLLGADAAVNFPASSYDAAELRDASRYIQCVLGGALPATMAGGSDTIRQALASTLLMAVHNRASSSSAVKTCSG